MSRNNRQPSQRPAHQQVSTRTAGPGEDPQDTTRIPSAATDSQSMGDALAADPDRYVAQPGFTDTDPLPGEATDVSSDEDPDDVDEGEDEDEGDDSDVEEDFGGFEDISERPSRRVKVTDKDLERAVQAAAPVVIHRDAAEQEAYDSELVPIIPRQTQQRVNIGGEWYNFIKGQEQFVARAVATHLQEKGLI